MHTERYLRSENAKRPEFSYEETVGWETHYLAGLHLVQGPHLHKTIRIQQPRK
jgi:hypothetical protein